MGHTVIVDRKDEGPDQRAVNNKQNRQDHKIMEFYFPPAAV